MHELLTIRRSMLLLLAAALLTTPALAEESSDQDGWPFRIIFNIGGMVPTGASSKTYDSSILLGGGLFIPVRSWIDVEAAQMDFGFNTTDDSRLVNVSDGSRRKTHNYQMMASSGVRFNIPFRKDSRLFLGGGPALVTQSEYVFGRSFYQNGVLVTERIDCRDCAQQELAGGYVSLGVGNRDTKGRGVAIVAKYYVMREMKKLQGSFPRERQSWLTVGLNFVFGR